MRWRGTFQRRTTSSTTSGVPIERLLSLYSAYAPPCDGNSVSSSTTKSSGSRLIFKRDLDADLTELKGNSPRLLTRGRLLNCCAHVSPACRQARRPDQENSRIRTATNWKSVQHATEATTFCLLAGRRRW